MVNSFKVHPQLVHSPCFWNKLNQRCVAEALADNKFCLCFPNLGQWRFTRHCALKTHSANRQFNRSSRLFYSAIHYRKVSFCNIAAFEELLEILERFLIFCNYQYPGGILVQTMHNAGPIRIFTYAPDFGCMRKDKINKSMSIFSARGGSASGGYPCALTVAT